jgi:predicted dehydrogenase
MLGVSGDIQSQRVMVVFGNSDKLNRRKFTQATAGMAIPTFIPGSALGLGNAVAPSERIRLAGIGIRNRGSKVLGAMLAQPDVQFVAICDVRADRRAAVKKMADDANGNDQCATYIDMHEMLDRDDIDAVVIATGDRWHAPASIHALQAGKDVYCEKPCGITIEMCQKLADTVERHGRVFQAGTQRRNQNHFAHACRLAQSGGLGNIETVHASIYELANRHDWLPAQPAPAPEVIDWDRWLGPAPWRPFNQSYVDGRWRGYHDFDSGAKLLDWGAHTLDLCQWACGQDGSMPVEWEPQHVPGDNVIHGRYGNGVKVVLRKSGWLGLGTCPIRLEGTDGWIETGDSGRLAVSNDRLRGELPTPADAGTIPWKHVRDFFDCVKTRGQTRANANVMRSSHLACHMAAISWILGRKVLVDPAQEVFIGDDQANRMCRRAMRAPYGV